MDQRERYADDAEVMRIAMEALQSRLWTALPCVVQAFPAASGLDPMMLDAQPVLAGSYVDSSGNLITLQMPLLVDIPVWFPGGGGATLTFPIKKGDECLVVFAARCIDAWWQLGVGSGSAPGRVPPDARMHNLSDGIAYVGLRNSNRSYAVDTANVQLRSDDGSTFVQMNPAGKVVKITAPNGVNINGVTIDSAGNVNSPATITAATEVKVGSHTLTQHQHVDPQGGSVAKPTG